MLSVALRHCFHREDDRDDGPHRRHGAASTACSGSDYLDGVVSRRRELSVPGMQTATARRATTRPTHLHRRSSTGTWCRRRRLTIHDYPWHWTPTSPGVDAFGARPGGSGGSGGGTGAAVSLESIAYDECFGIATMRIGTGRAPRSGWCKTSRCRSDAAPIPGLVFGQRPDRADWLCPLRLRDSQGWPLCPIRPGHTYVNVGFWSSVPVGSTEGETNRKIERKISDLDGHKSLFGRLFRRRVRRTLWRRGLQDAEEVLRS